MDDQQNPVVPGVEAPVQPVSVPEPMAAPQEPAPVAMPTQPEATPETLVTPPPAV